MDTLNEIKKSLKNIESGVFTMGCSFDKLIGIARELARENEKLSGTDSLDTILKIDAIKAEYTCISRDIIKW